MLREEHDRVMALLPEEKHIHFEEQLEHLTKDPCFGNLRHKIVKTLAISFEEYTRRRVMELDPDTGEVPVPEEEVDLGPINNRTQVRSRVELICRKMEGEIYRKKNTATARQRAAKLALAGYKMLDEMDASAKATDAFAEKIGSMSAQELTSFLENVSGYLTGSAEKSLVGAVPALGAGSVAGGGDGAERDAAAGA